MKKLTLLDEKMFQWIAAMPSNQPERLIPRVFHKISKTGDGYLYAPIAAILYYFDSHHGQLFLYTAVMAYIFEIPIYLAMKHLFKRPRPCERLLQFNAMIIPADKFSLPSGHTAAAFLMATVVSYFYPSFMAVAICWAFLIGLSRIVLRVHYPLDVVIGAFLGVFVASVSILVLG